MTYAVGIAESWLYWPFIAGAVFWWKYDKAKRKFEEQNPGSRSAHEFDMHRSIAVLTKYYVPVPSQT